MNCSSLFFLDRNLKVKNLNIEAQLDDQKNDIFFPVMKSEINCTSDGLVETTKTSLPCSPAVEQLVC